MRTTLTTMTSEPVSEPKKPKNRANLGSQCTDGAAGSGPQPPPSCSSVSRGPSLPWHGLGMACRRCTKGACLASLPAPVLSCAPILSSFPRFAF